jgi:Bacterial TSP3 repeat
MGRRVIALAFALGLASCASGAPPDHASGPEASMADASAPDPTELDSDGDGLCDATEEELGTNPQSNDTDGDRVPDLIELASDFDPVDPADPALDQIAYLEGARGASLDFEVRTTVDGDGQSLSGWFSPAGSFYTDGLTAADFFDGSTAISADPVDAARSINQEAASFAAVLGRTRLAFDLRFDFGARPDLKCGRVYPFRYAIKSDDGDTRSERFYLLIVGPSGGTGPNAGELCAPVECQ